MKILVYGAGVLGCNLARNLFHAGKAATPEALAWYNAKHNKWINTAEKVLTLQKLYK